MKFLISLLSTRPLPWLLLVGAVGYATPTPAIPFPSTPQSDLPASVQAEGGASRSSSWNFVPMPGEGAPHQSQGGASRSSLSFVPAPGEGAPHQSQGGASRDTLNFVPAPGESIPRQSQGGASRGEEWSFIPPADQGGAPRQSRGGAARGDWNFIPASDHGTPNQSQGGASRETWNFTPAPGEGTPSHTHSGASRTDWPQQMLTLTPEPGYGQTTHRHPQFLFYLPESHAQSGVFRLKDEMGNVLYEQTLTNPHQAGIVAIQLPEHLPALEVDQYYQWYVVLQLAAELQPASPFVAAWVKRVEPTPELRTAAADGQTTTLAYAQQLAQAGIWYDTVATLNQLRTAQPTSAALANHWQELLGSVGLESVAGVPMFE